MSEAGGGLRMIAIGLAVAAVGLAGVTALVVISRDGGGGASGAPGIDHARASEPAMPEARHVAATDLVRLKRDAVAAVLEHGDPIGLRVSDADLRDKLGLGNDD
ncbi:MAG: hypothetical protein NT062_24385, partial [Proteobacteria bacterium]|nr:hypothetical protein [Pseudomonadota bacterium]